MAGNRRSGRTRSRPRPFAASPPPDQSCRLRFQRAPRRRPLASATAQTNRAGLPDGVLRPERVVDERELLRDTTRPRRRIAPIPLPARRRARRSPARIFRDRQLPGHLGVVEGFRARVLGEGAPSFFRGGDAGKIGRASGSRTARRPRMARFRRACRDSWWRPGAFASDDLQTQDRSRRHALRLHRVLTSCREGLAAGGDPKVDRPGGREGGSPAG